MKIGLLIPSTSNNREWNSLKESYLYNLTFKTFLLTHDPAHEYIIYIGIDRGDKIYDDAQQQDLFFRFKLIYKNISCRFIYIDADKGHLTKMWNQLFRLAYDEGCEYFYQCGDDIKFTTKGWINDSITMLQSNKNIGITGPTNNNNFILTQVFVSRVHMEIFNYFFPETILNWGCDDWYNAVYKPDYYFPLKDHYCSNEGGSPRYVVNNNPTFWLSYKKNVDILRRKSLLKGVEDRPMIDQYINSLN